MRVIQVKLSPSCSQITLLNDLLEEHISLYNSTLECKKILYESFDGQKLSCFDAIKEIIPEFKKLGELKLANYSSAQQTIRRLDKAFNRFFHGNGFPRFKNKDRFNTVEYGKYGDGCKIKKDKLYIQNIGLVKCLWYCDINQKNIRTLSITRKNDSFYVNFIVNEDKNIRISFTNKNIGLDFGLKTFITTSDGEKYDSPKYLKKSLKRIKKANRKLSRSPNKGSIEREKSKKVLNKIYTKINNQRKDFNHKLSRKFVNENDIICIENIKLNNLVGNIKNINRTYNDVSFGQFRTFLIYKAENAGKIIVKVNPFNTTKECHKCGRIVEKTLDERVHKCECGCVEDRDINAAKNILRRGLASLELAKANS